MNNQIHRNIDSSADIKRGAQELLKGRWTEAVLTALIPAVFSFLFFRNITDGESSGFLYDLIEGFLLTGMTFGFMNIARSSSYILQPFQAIASPFRSEYFKNLLFLKLWKYLYISLWTLLFIIPGIVKMYSYSQAELLYKDYVDNTGKQPDARMILEESSEMMNGYKGALFYLDFSFIGWLILNGLTLGILGLWLTPYRTMSRVVFYESLSGKTFENNGTSKDAASMRREREAEKRKHEEVGKDPEDFRDFEDF